MIKTIAQIANEIGVSKQAVWQKIKREPLATNLNKFTQKLGNTVYISNEGISIIKNCFLKNKIDETSININCHQPNINKTSIDVNNNQDNNLSIDINKHQYENSETSINIDDGQEEKNNDNENINIDVNKHQSNENKTSVDKIVDVLLLQLETLNKQNENLAKELSNERKHSRELADKLAEIASNAQKLHAGDIVTPRLNMNDVELNPKENTKKKSGMFHWLLNKNKKK